MKVKHSKRNITIFYSWQSWTSKNLNRNFIQKALENSIKRLKNVEYNIQPVVDRDTRKVSGSPDIAKVIFDKIKESDIFVADITSVIRETIDDNVREIPNPNVLIELGYATSELGWDSIICVFNKAFGNPDNLPFDLRKHRITNYYHSLEDEQNTEIKTKNLKELSETFYVALREIEINTPPEIEYLNTLIRNQFTPLHVYLKVIFWMQSNVKIDINLIGFVLALVHHLSDYAEKISKQELPELMVDKSHAFTNRQKLRCRKLIEVTSAIATYAGMVKFMRDKPAELQMTQFNEIMPIISDWGKQWISLVEDFDNKHSAVNILDEYLNPPTREERLNELEDGFKQGILTHVRDEVLASFNDTDKYNEMLQFEKNFAKGFIYRFYDEELARIVWEMIQLFKDKHDN